MKPTVTAIPYDHTLRKAVLMLLEAENILVQWAVPKRQIKRLWLFGSRVGGTAKLDSDIDIALELFHEPDWEMSVVDLWEKYGDVWREELAQLLPWNVDLEFFDPKGSTPNLALYLNARSLLVFDRTAANTAMESDA